MKIIHGKKSTMFPFAECDEQDWKRMLEHDGDVIGAAYFADFEGYYLYTLQQLREGSWQAWAVTTNNLGKEKNKKIGFIVLTDYCPKLKSCSMMGMMDKEIARGLIPLLKREDKLTYAEDSTRSVINFCFNDFGLMRLQAEITSSNRAARKLVEKCGFKKEASLTNASMKDGKIENLIIYTLLKQ